MPFPNRHSEEAQLKSKTGYPATRKVIGYLILFMVVGICASKGGVSEGMDGPEDSRTRIPAFRGTTFTNQPVSLPEDLQGKIGVLVIGYSQGSREAVAGWGKRLATDYRGSSSVLYYEMPVLASVPRLLRGYVTNKIKSEVSEPARPRFVPITENEAAWRALTHYERGDNAYVIVVDGEGTVLWQTHAEVTDAVYAKLKEQLGMFHPVLRGPAK